ncbi:heme-binding protein 1-like isoform X2 [Lissotriton helveticus]
MSLITLEDLNQLEDELMEDDGTQEQQQDNLAQSQFSHWEAVATAHRVSLPPDIAGPISEMSRQSHMREPIPFVPLSYHEKVQDEAYEERQYPAGKWVCIRKQEPLYEQSTAYGFMQLMRYICKENSRGRYLGMTVPVLNRIQMNENDTAFVGEVSTEFYLPAEFQQDPPLPQDPEVLIIDRESFRVISRKVSFSPVFGYSIVTEYICFTRG